MNETELKRLTVARLKLMCKEKNIAGYSKLGKNYIIEKLVNWQRSQAPAAATGNNLALQLEDTVSINPADASRLQPLATDGSTLHGTSLVSALPVDSDPNAFITSVNSSAITVSMAETEYNHGSMAVISLPIDKEPQQLEQDPALMSSKNGQNSSYLVKASTRKRLLDGEESFRLKKVRIDELHASAGVSTLALKVSGVERAKLMLPPEQVNHSKIDKSQSSDTSKKPQQPQQPGISLLQAGSKKPQPPGVSLLKAGQTKPFKALVPVALQKVTNWNQPSTNGGSESLTRKPLISPISADLDFPQEKPVELGLIALAPSISQRKRAPNFALLLSSISVQDLAACAQVSRLFRYSGKFLLSCLI